MADNESDGVNEAFTSKLQTGLTAAALLAEQAARAREQAARDAQAASEQLARQARERLNAERAAARSALAPVWRREWWESAGPEHIAEAWETAQTWRETDAAAGRAAARIRDEVLRRYGVDADAAGGDRAAVAEAMRRREREARDSERKGSQARGEEAQAARVAADSDRDGRDRYDSVERRRGVEERLQRRGVDAETVEAQVTADVNQARPAQEAVRVPPARTPSARRSRPQRRGREQQRQPVRDR